MANDIEELVKRVIKEDLGNLISQELEMRFKPIQAQIDIILKGQDAITQQLREDRKDINEIKIDQAKSTKQNEVIIENQDHQEEKIVEVMEKATEDIKPAVEKSVEEMFKKESFLKRLVNRFKK